MSRGPSPLAEQLATATRPWSAAHSHSAGRLVRRSGSTARPRRRRWRDGSRTRLAHGDPGLAHPLDRATALVDRWSSRPRPRRCQALINSVGAGCGLTSTSLINKLPLGRRYHRFTHSWHPFGLPGEGCDAQLTTAP